MYLSLADGYIRMSLVELESTPLIHLISKLDEDSETTEDGLALPITGYSEWISSGIPAITLGWDWHLELSREQINLILLNEPRSNIMLVDDNKADLGPYATRCSLAKFVDDLPWRDEIIRSLDISFK